MLVPRSLVHLFHLPLPSLVREYLRRGQSDAKLCRVISAHHQQLEMLQWRVKLVDRDESVAHHKQEGPHACDEGQGRVGLGQGALRHGQQQQAIEG